MKTSKSQTFPTLYHKGKKGEIRTWNISVTGDTISVSHGVQHGQMQIVKTVASPKNIGKANATTAEEQALLEANAMHVYQLDRKYSLSIEETKDTKIRPMLAQSFADKKKKVQYPVDCQPKLDGVRALAYWENGKVVLMSRSGKPYTVPHISKALEPLLIKGDVYDGEIYIHGKSISFETKMSWIKRQQPDTLRLQYHIYDVPVHNGQSNLTSNSRMDVIFMLRSYHAANPIIKFVATNKCYSEQEVLDFEKACLLDAYEGAMVRLLNGLYKYGARSSDLLKVKSFSDEEYSITGYEVEKIRKEIQGKDISLDCVVWQCSYTNNNNQKDYFTVRPIGAIETRAETLKEYRKNPSKFLGKLYKVKYFEKTAANAPRFPIGLGFRLEEDV